MPLITLGFDASTYAGSVAVFRDREVIAERMLEQTSGPVQGTRAEGMMPAAAKALEDAGLGPGDVNRVLCGEGPGSFTSLRIAASLAKGFAHSRDIPLYSVSSLLLIAASAPVNVRPVVAAITAMRGEFYAADYQITCDNVTETVAPRIIEESAMLAYAQERNARLLIAGREGVNPAISAAARLLDTIFDKGPVNLGSWEPTYGRLAEAQVRWEKASGRPLTA
jgi:tRNA threonylcarbamoyladenosine biosynthesis protein TsaB